MAADNNLKCYLPTEMQFAPPKRCGLEAEILGKITKSFSQVRSFLTLTFRPDSRYDYFSIQFQTSQQQAGQQKRKSNASANSSYNQQILVLTHGDVVDDNIIIEQDNPVEPTKNSNVVVHTRSRKQDLASLSSDEHSSDLPSAPKKLKTEETDNSDHILTSTPIVSIRSTRSASSKIADSMDEDSADQSKESDSERSGGRRSRQVRSTRTTGKESEVTNSGDDDSSPTRKSARIARK